MKNNKVKTWKKFVTAAMLTLLTLAFAGCDTDDEESSIAEVVTTTITTEATIPTKEVTTTTAKTTKAVPETTAVTTVSETTAAAETAAPELEQKQTAVQAEPLVQKATTVKPAQPTPAKTTAAPKGHYETVHHDAVTEQVWVEDSPAEVHYKIVCRCGKEFNNFDEWDAHDTDAYLSGDDTHYSYQNIPYETPAQGHYETRVVKVAYDEQVWVQN